MDLVPSCTVAASILGLSSGHPFVFLGRTIQETCLKVGDATDGEVLLAGTVTRVGGSGGLLLFWSGYVDVERSADPLSHADALISLGVGSMAHALRQVDAERRLADGPRGPHSPPRHQPSTAELEEAGDALGLGIPPAAIALMAASMRMEMMFTMERRSSRRTVRQGLF